MRMLIVIVTVLLAVVALNSLAKAALVTQPQVLDVIVK